MQRKYSSFLFFSFFVMAFLSNYSVNSQMYRTFTMDHYKNGDVWQLRSGRYNYTCYSGRVLFPYGPECADEELSKDLYRSRRLDLGFNMTIQGHKFDKAWINQHGFISFQESYYGAAVSNNDWPHPFYPYHDDPVFIAPFYAQTDLLGDKVEDVLTTKYGRVLYKVMHRKDLPLIYTEEEKFMYEMTMNILNEGQKLVRESISGVEFFIASHAVIATWKSLAFGGSSVSDVNAKPRNTFQLTLLSDTNLTFAIFNYEDIQWYASTTQGGNPETGTGGKAAKIGFNRGNGTMWYGIKPFSENAQLMPLIENRSNVDVPGRYIFRVDEWIQPGGCMNFDFGDEKKLNIWPRSGNLLGGQEVNITGPCFENNHWFHCKWGDGFDAPISVGETPVIGSNRTEIRARCIQPLMYFIGRINLSISLDHGKTYDWKAEYTIVDPLRYPAKVELVNINDWHELSSPARLIVRWDRHELSYAESDPVNVKLFGYYEDDHGPHWDLIQIITTDKPNKGSYGFDVAPNRAKNQTMARMYKLGAIRVSMVDTILDPDLHFVTPKHIWSALHPIGWWRHDEMKFYYDKSSYLFGSSRGKNWPEDQCRWWHQYRKYDRFWMDDLEHCPPTVFFAIGDLGVWMPDPSCNMYGSSHNELNCLQHPEASHCVITMRRTQSGAGNRCCYNKDGNLMYTNDTYSGSTPDRHHFLGMPPYNVYGKVPALSHYLHDVVPYYLCCKWGKLCDTYLYLRQTKDSKGYKEPRPAVAYGDPHFITFDGKDYTFNGKGEFTLFRSRKHNFRLQARFEQPPNATYCLLSSKGQINATRITAIVAGQDDSDYVEIRTRLFPSQSSILRCDVLINGKTYYFNYTEEKIQIFSNVYVYSPHTDKHQSNITIMFNTSGVGVQVSCLYGMIHVRVSAPYSLFKDTAGLFGYWDNITANDFMSPDNSSSQLTLKPDLLYQRFGMAWRMKDESESMFTYSGSWNFDTFHDNKPIIREWQRFRPWFVQGDVPFPSNVSFTKDDMIRVCEEDEQCLYDAAAMGSLDIGQYTRDSHRFSRHLLESMKAVNSCGIYLMMGGIRKTNTGNYLAGSKMKLSCEKGYTIFGWQEFHCNWNGTWLPTNGQWLAQFRDWPYCEHYHVTAIRYTAIGISVLWILIVAFILIRRYCCKKQNDYFIDDHKTDKDNKFPFKDAENPSEFDALNTLDSNNYHRDGFEHSKLSIKKQMAEDTDSLDKPPETEENTSLFDQIKNATLVRVDKIEAPAVILQTPIQTSQQSAKVFEVIKDEPRKPSAASSKNSKQDDSRKPNINSFNNSRQEQINEANNEFIGVQYPKHDDGRKPSVNSFNSSRQNQINEPKNNQSAAAIYSVPKSLPFYGTERPPNFVRQPDENDSVFEDSFNKFPPAFKKYRNYTPTPPINESDAGAETYERVDNFRDIRRQQQYRPPRNDFKDSSI